jgi:hypothetical protein
MLDVVAASPILFTSINYEPKEGSFDLSMLLVILKLPRLMKLRSLFKVSY